MDSSPRTTLPISASEALIPRARSAVLSLAIPGSWNTCLTCSRQSGGAASVAGRMGCLPVSLLTTNGFGRASVGCLPVNPCRCMYDMPSSPALCSGAGRTGKVLRARGWEVVSVDCDAKMQPTIVGDIGAFDYKMLGGISMPCGVRRPVLNIRSPAITPKRQGASRVPTGSCGDAET